jgi:haloacetate dehalogenase
MTTDSALFPGFTVEDVPTSGAAIRTLRKGSGPPLLLLHGYPQTHVMWHRIADRLAARFTVVITDLRGYGDSSKPGGGARHVNYSFRAMARDQCEVMRRFGYERFLIASHDRGADPPPSPFADSGRRSSPIAIVEKNDGPSRSSSRRSGGAGN